jgi:hypothetical protein
MHFTNSDIRRLAYRSVRPAAFGSYRVATMVLGLVLLFSGAAAKADELADRVAFWRQKAFLCESGASKFPSKYSSSDPSHCEDGDMTLFNGLLCASGEKQGCDGVAGSQQIKDSDKGRWWRSPRRIGWDSTNGHDVSFSPDQALGVLHYIVATKDVAAFDQWIDWINNHRQPVTREQVKELFASANAPPLLLELAAALIAALPPHPTYCTDDHDLRCALRPGDCELINSVGKALGRSPDVCRGYLFFDTVSAIVSQTGLKLPNLLSAGASRFNEPDYPLHLAAVQVFLLTIVEKPDPLLTSAARTLADRDKLNPFFAYLAGDLDKARSLTLSECPTAAAPSMGEPQEWAWERASSEKRWLRSMYWDCIFMANLLK